MKIWQTAGIFLLFITQLIILQPVKAVTVEISNVPESITDQPFEFNVQIQGAQSGTNYLKASFYIPGTDNYFGYTFNGTDFYNGSDFSQYLPITISPEGSGSATIKAKIDSSSNHFEGQGAYNFKVRRYTSQTYNTSSNITTLTVNYTLPPTPTPIPTNTPTNEPTPTPKPTSTPKPTPIISVKNSPTKNLSPTPSSLKPTNSLPESILGANIKTTTNPSPTSIQQAGFSFNNFLFVGGGAVLILSSILAATFFIKKK